MSNVPCSKTMETNGESRGVIPSISTIPTLPDFLGHLKHKVTLISSICLEKINVVKDIFKVTCEKKKTVELFIEIFKVLFSVCKCLPECTPMHHVSTVSSESRTGLKIP